MDPQDLFISGHSWICDPMFSLEQGLWPHTGYLQGQTALCCGPSLPCSWLSPSRYRSIPPQS